MKPGLRSPAMLPVVRRRSRTMARKTHLKRSSCQPALLPFGLAALVRRTKSQRIEHVVIVALSAVLILNYLAYLVFIRSRGVVDWRQMLPMQMCDWGMVVVIVAMWTGNQRWFEVAYFWA